MKVVDLFTRKAVATPDEEDETLTRWCEQHIESFQNETIQLMNDTHTLADLRERVRNIKAIVNQWPDP